MIESVVHPLVPANPSVPINSVNQIYRSLKTRYNHPSRPEFRIPLILPGGLLVPSATGAATFLRTMAGFSFPPFAPKLYAELGLGWGNGLLAFISLGED